MKALPKIALFVIGLLFFFTMGFALRDIRAGEAPSKAALQALVLGPGKTPQTPTKLFKQNFDFIQANYDLEMPAGSLKYAAMEGLMTSLGDPNTVFLEPRISEDFAMETRGDFVGVGAELRPDPLGAKVGEVFADHPADKAGVKSGDIVVAVDGKDVSGMDVSEIVGKIRGEPGTTVTLQVIRSGEPKPLSIPIKRGVVVRPTARGKMLPGSNVGLITVRGFSENTTDQFNKALDDLMAQNPDGLVVDVRSNPGGLLETAVEMLGRFVEDKPVVTLKGKGGKQDTVSTSSGRAIPSTVPVVVLVNEESASASEIFAGVLRDYKRASLVGDHTYGKASVQNVFMLRDTSSAKITIARYYLPSGEDISRRIDEEGQYVSGGLKPDVQAALEIDENTVIGDPETDSQLKRAIQLVKEKRGQSRHSLASPGDDRTQPTRMKPKQRAMAGFAFSG